MNERSLSGRGAELGENSGGSRLDLADTGSSTDDLSLVHRFMRRVRQSPLQVALRYKANGEWQATSWEGWFERVRHLAAGLGSLGVVPGDRIAILCNTRIEWVVVDLASWMLGAVSVAIYPQQTADQIAFILQDCSARWLICEDAAQLASVVDRRRELSSLAGIVYIEPIPSRLATSIHTCPLIVSWSELEELGVRLWSAQAAEIERRLATIEPATLATLSYTSGTNGKPKGVRISHANLMYSTEASVEPLGITASDIQLLFLPLAHIVGRQLIASSFVSGCTTALDASPYNLLDNCRFLRATYFCGVPRILEKLYSSFAELPGERLREALGGRMRFILSGGAALPARVTEFFRAVGVPVYEGYGLTETAGTLTINLPRHYRDGSVGRPARGTELRIAEDGEILASGPGVMLGYHNRMDDDHIASASMDGRRWFHTGDVGRIDADGYLWIIDRKKDLFKLSTGKYVAPLALESRLKSSGALLSQVFVHGENRPFVVALCTLSPDAVAAFGTELGVMDPAALHVHPEVAGRVERLIDELNEDLAPFERIKKFALVYPDFALLSGELTPTLKLKRRVVVEKHQALLERLYGAEG